MASVRNEGGVFSVKRQALSPPRDTHAVEELDDAIWTSIIAFLPTPKDLETNNKERCDVRVSEVVATWQTLLRLRLVSRQLAALLHPRDQTMWRRLVLHCFDFSSGDSFNWKNYVEELRLVDPDDKGDSSDDEHANEELGDEKQEEDAEPDPQYLALRGRYHVTPKNYMKWNLKEWLKIGICHRPSQYGFLTTLQKLPPKGSWPEGEDAFTLFADFVRLLQLPHVKGMETGGEGSDEPFKHLAAPSEAGPSSRYYRCYVMKTLGYAPQLWNRGFGIGKEWKGFTKPEAMEALIAEQLVDKRGEDVIGDRFSSNDELGFPMCSVRATKQIFDHARKHCLDWRSVCCNEGWDGETPVFYVGESKAFPHRWTGYGGQKTWT